MVNVGGSCVDLFGKGSLIPELQDFRMWEKLKGSLREGGRVMVNVGGSCVEAEVCRRDGRVVMEETLRAMSEVFGEVWLLSLGNGKDDSNIALTGGLPDRRAWERALPKGLKFYVDTWKPYDG